MDKILENLPRINDPIKERMAEDKNSPLNEIPPLTRVRQKQSVMSGTITNIAHDLSDTMLLGNNTASEMLEKQLGMLHSLFQITAHKISGTQHIGDDAPTTYFDTNNLELALRVQEQCTDTAKALSQIAYMKHLRGYPHPVIESKQKEEP